MSGLEKKLWKCKRRFGYCIDITNHDNNARYLIGWPGYRTSRDKSGLDYIESRAELAHMYAVFLKWLATGQFRTHNLVYLLMMIGFGLLFGGMPLACIIYDSVVHQNWILLSLPLFVPHILVGLLLLVNAVLSIVYWNGKTITGD